MRKPLSLFIIVLSCICVISCSRTDNKPAAAPTAEVGGTAPDFTLKDTAGRDVSFTAYRGKIVLLEFWATWCPPCKASVPDLVALQNKFPSGDFTVLGISLDANADASSRVSQFIRTNSINYPVLLGDDIMLQTYNVISIPVSYLIDKNGKIVDVYMGYNDSLGRKISTQIEKLL